SLRATAARYSGVPRAGVWCVSPLRSALTAVSTTYGGVCSAARPAEKSTIDTPRRRISDATSAMRTVADGTASRMRVERRPADGGPEWAPGDGGAVRLTTRVPRRRPGRRSVAHHDVQSFESWASASNPPSGEIRGSLGGPAYGRYPRMRLVGPQGASAKLDGNHSSDTAHRTAHWRSVT